MRNVATPGSSSTRTKYAAPVVLDDEDNDVVFLTPPLSPSSSTASPDGDDDRDHHQQDRRGRHHHHHHRRHADSDDDAAAPPPVPESGFNNNNAVSSSPPATKVDSAAIEDAVDEQQGPEGCYLVYEPSSGGRLMLQYSKGPIPAGAVGFWCPGTGQKIQPFKFKQAGGKSELIKGIAGGDANKRKYYSGWCQFLKLAKAKRGRVIQFAVSNNNNNHGDHSDDSQVTTTTTQGIAVDVYAYNRKHNAPVMLPLTERLVSVSDYDAVAVMARHHSFLEGVKSIAVGNFLEGGNLAGSSTTM